MNKITIRHRDNYFKKNLLFFYDNLSCVLNYSNLHIKLYFHNIGLTKRAFYYYAKSIGKLVKLTQYEKKSSVCLSASMQFQYEPAGFLIVRFKLLRRCFSGDKNVNANSFPSAIIHRGLRAMLTAFSDSYTK